MLLLTCFSKILDGNGVLDIGLKLFSKVMLPFLGSGVTLAILKHCGIWPFTYVFSLLTYVFSLQADSTYRWAQTLTDTKTTVLYWHAPTEDTFLRLCIIMRVSNHLRLLLTGR